MTRGERGDATPVVYKKEKVERVVSGGNLLWMDSMGGLCVGGLRAQLCKGKDEHINAGQWGHTNLAVPVRRSQRGGRSKMIRGKKEESELVL